MTRPNAARELAGGLVLRSAEEHDVDDIVELCTAAFGAADSSGILGAIEEGGGTANWAVVVDPSDRVVSTSTLLDLTLLIDDAEVPAAQVEWVATDPTFQRKGLVRAQFDRHHDLAAERGALVLFIAGIPYFYRQFGYGYGVDYPPLYVFDLDELRAAAHRAEARSPSGAPPTVRAATDGDVGALRALESTRMTTGVRAVRDDRFWRRRLAQSRGDRRQFEQLVVVERDGEVCGWLTAKADEQLDKRLHCKPGAARDADAAIALLHFMAEQAATRELLLIADGAAASVYGDAVARLGRPITLYAGYYTRTPDPLALLDRLRPTLTARLQASGAFETHTGTLAVSLFTSGVALDIESGSVTRVRPIPPVEDPLDDLSVGVAPDAFPALVLGRWGAVELARRVDDVLLGQHAALMEVLFPKRPVDISADL